MQGFNNPDLIPVLGAACLATFVLMAAFYASAYLYWLLPSAAIMAVVLFVRIFGERR